ncbi:MAG: hypothetical protein ACO3ZZ_01115, partial [Solirubrobacterales bacterium]
MESKGKVAFLVLGALLAGSLVTAGPASAGKAKVEILRADQTSATGKGLRVLVRARAGTSLSLTAFSRTFDDGTNRASRPVRVRIGASGRRTVQIGLVAGARKAARECGERTFIVRAGRGASGSARGSMTRNRSACRARPLALDRAEECDFIALPD